MIKAEKLIPMDSTQHGLQTQHLTPIVLHCTRTRSIIKTAAYSTRARHGQGLSAELPGVGTIHGPRSPYSKNRGLQVSAIVPAKPLGLHPIVAFVFKLYFNRFVGFRTLESLNHFDARMIRATQKEPRCGLPLITLQPQ